MLKPEAIFEKIVQSHFEAFERKIRKTLGWGNLAVLEEGKPTLKSWRTKSGKAKPDGLLRESESDKVAVVDFKVGVRQSWSEVKDQMVDYKRGAEEKYGSGTPVLLICYYPLQDVSAAGLIPLKILEVVRLDERDVSLGRGMMKIRGKGSREDWVSFSAVSKRRLWSCLLVRFYSVRPLFCRMLRAPPPLP